MKYLFLILSLTTAAQASANPLNFLKRTIKHHGYILYQNPLSSAGTGTLVGGKPNSMVIAADPQRCFPDLIDDGYPSLIRKVEDTNLGSISQTTSFEGKVGLDLVKFINNGNSIFTIGVGGSVIQTVELAFEGAKIEYIDTVALQEFYREHMSADCKTALDYYGFIVQALRVDKMRYSFKDKGGAYLKLNMDGISKLFNIDLDVKYHIEQDYQLVIDTPKYIGYQLGRLNGKDEGRALYRSQKVFFNRYIFQSSSIFKK